MDLLILLLIVAVAGGTALAVFLRTDMGSDGPGVGHGNGNGGRASHAHRPGVLALLVSELTQLYAFLGVFIVSGLILFAPTRGAFGRPEELEADAYETKDSDDKTADSDAETTDRDDG